MKKRYSLIGVFLVSGIVGAKNFLVFGGKSGWIGQKIMQEIERQGHNAYAAQSRLEQREHIEAELDAVKPDYIINAAGIIGKPNVDWTETHQQETIRSNIIGALNLADIAYQHDLPLINIGTGCIYEYDEHHPMYSGKGFTENDEPNLKSDGAFYSLTKIMLEKLFAHYPNVLNLRLRLPIASDFYTGNLLMKLPRYPKVVNIPNSVSVLDDLIPLIPQMALRNLRGIYNFVNPGTIDHNEILDLYKYYLDPSFEYENFTLQEQEKILKAKRCYNELCINKLLQEFPDIPPIQVSIHTVYKKLKTMMDKKHVVFQRLEKSWSVM